MNPKRILAVQVKMIGDLLLTLPALQCLRKTWPDASLELITLGPAAQLAPCLPWVDRIYTWKKGGNNWQTIKPLFTQIYRCRPELSLDFSGTDRAGLLTLMGKERIGYQKYLKSRALRGKIYSKTSPAILKRQHASSYYLGLLAALDLAPAEDERGTQLHLPPLHIPEIAHEQAAHALHLGKIFEDFIVIQAGSARAEKCWPAANWARIIQELHAKGVPVVLLGGNSEQERDHLERIELLSLPAKPLNLAGKLSLPASLAVLAQARALLSVDSALMHAAASWQKPQLALFGSTHPHQWGPWNPNALSLHAAKPEKARRREEWFWQEQLPKTTMKELSVDCVLQGMEILL